MKQLKSLWVIGLGVLILIIGLSGVFQSVKNLSVGEDDYGQPGMEELGFVPMAMPVQALGQQSEAPAMVVTPPGPEAAASLTAQVQNATPVPITKASPTPSPTVPPVVPERITIEKINLDAPIIPALVKQLKLDDTVYEQWLAPDEYAVGWHYNTALLGQPGNTVLNGHHNIAGMVFENLHQLAPGDIIELHGEGIKFSYMVVNVMILPERGQEFTVRLDNARWLLPSTDERITLITCWPATSNTHRLIVVARPHGAPEVEPVPTPREPE